jgi:hypothetical protein
LLGVGDHFLGIGNDFSAYVNGSAPYVHDFSRYGNGFAAYVNDFARYGNGFSLYVHDFSPYVNGFCRHVNGFAAHVNDFSPRPIQGQPGFVLYIGGADLRPLHQPLKPKST